MHDEELFKRALHHDDHPQELANLFKQVDEATKNFQVGKTKVFKLSKLADFWSVA